MENIIVEIEKNSIAEELGIEKGDLLLSVNGKTINDIFDYRYLIKDSYVEILIRKKNEEILFEIEKDEDEDLGIDFENPLMDLTRSCRNKCIFCFIDQLPKNMRDTLYFKDDDSRLSFLQGNYITLTNMDENDIDRIIFYHLSPINISVHTTDPELRLYMLKNPNSKNIMKRLEKLCNANIEMNYQIVLCKGINDAENLDKTIEDLSKFINPAKSLSVVPVGLTKFRDNLYPLMPFEKEDALKVIEKIEAKGREYLEKYGTRFVFPSDEFYLKAGLKLPDYDYYEDFPQLENGVGMLSLFEWEFINYLKKLKPFESKRRVSIVTAESAAVFIEKLTEKLVGIFPDLEIRFFKIKNEFFGESITVTGLLTGRDIINTLMNKNLGECVLIPENALRQDDKIFLDDVYLRDLTNILNVDVKAVQINGAEFIKKILGI